MKKIFLLLLLLNIFSCKDKTYPYVVKIYQENTLLGDVSTDEIQAKDDIDGYFMGISYYFTYKAVIKGTKHGTVTGFDVYDQNGVNLKYKLNKHQMDSVTNLVEKNMPKDTLFK